MTKLPRVSIACIASVLLQTGLALADPPSVARPLSVDGRPGLWLPGDMARSVLADVEELQTRRVESALCRKQAATKDERIKELSKALDAARQSAAASQAVVETAMRAQRVAEQARDGWLAGKPWLWTTVGVVSGVLGSLAVFHYAR
jgi:ElaB/YqjD/DUF883 family membrane-anchored ribosome-binding protein